jgi:hypothetical protein
MIGIGLGIFMNELVQKELEPINKTRTAAGLKPLTPFEYFDASKDLGDLKGKEYSKAVMQKLTANTKAEIAALKAVPKGTFTSMVDDVAKKIGAPAAAVGVALEKLRTRKNANAAQADAMGEYMQYKYGFKTPSKTAAAPTKLPIGIGEATGNIAKGLFDRGGAIVAGGFGTGEAYFDAGYRAEQTVDETKSFPETKPRQFQYPVGASPVGMGMSPMAGSMPDMRRQGAIAKEIFKDPQFYYDAGFKSLDAFTLGALTRNQEYNRLSGLDGELSMGEQLMNFGKSVAAIPADIITLGGYDRDTIGKQFSPTREMLDNLQTSVDKNSQNKKAKQDLEDWKKQFAE